MIPENLTEVLKSKAREIGFDLVGISPAFLPQSSIDFFENWLKQGHHAGMEWMNKNKEKRVDAKKVLEGAKSIISVGLSYYRGHPLSVESPEEDRGWISNYAWGEDYHRIVLKKLVALEEFIVKRVGAPIVTKSYVDTGPILERSYAAQAGLGWIGKNTCLINRHRGSFFFIGEIITTLDLVPDTPDIDHCGKCTRCLDACPTQALKPYELDANLCISYLTIEHRGEISKALQEKMGSHLAGCDICQDVCPWNRDISLSREAAFDPRLGNRNPFLNELKSLTSDEFSQRFQGSAVRRVKWEGLMRNVSIAESNAS